MADFADMSSLPVNIKMGILSMMDGNVQSAVFKDTTHQRLPAVKFVTKSSLSPDYILQLTDLEMLNTKGYIIKDNFMGNDKCLTVLQEAEKLREKGMLKKAGMGSGENYWKDSNTRGDEVLWLNSILDPCQTPEVEKSSMEHLISLVKQIDLIRTQLNQSCDFGSEKTQVHLTCYPGEGARYVRHLDAFKGGSERRLTCIYYLNSNWTSKAGGSLRLYQGIPDMQETRLSSVPEISGDSGSAPRTVIPPTPASTPRSVISDNSGSSTIPPTPTSTPRVSEPVSTTLVPPTPASTPRANPDDSALPPTPASTPRVDSSVPADFLADVEPIGDRLLIFQSRLLEHEVLPTWASRYALTVWFY